MSLLSALDDPDLFGPMKFDASSWAPWRVSCGRVRLAYDRRRSGNLTGIIPDAPIRPQSRRDMLSCVVGRRGGKSRILASDSNIHGLLYRSQRLHCSR